MAWNGQIWVHSPQPVQRDGSICAFPPESVMAGQPISRMQNLQEVHFSVSTHTGAAGLILAMQGLRKMMARTPVSPAAFCTAATAAA